MKFIQDLIPVINDEREGEVLHWLLEGKSYRWIGRHMGIFSTQVNRIKDEIVNSFVSVLVRGK